MFRNKLAITMMLCMVVFVSTVQSFVADDLKWPLYYFGKTIQAIVCLCWAVSAARNWWSKIVMTTILINIALLDSVTLINAMNGISPIVPYWLYDYVNCLVVFIGYMWLTFSINEYRGMYFKRTALVFFVDSAKEVFDFFFMNNNGSEFHLYLQNGLIGFALVSFYIADDIKNKYVTLQTFKVDT